MRRNIISLLFILSFACSNEKTPVFQTNEENISLKDRHLKTNDNYFFLTKAHDAYINYKVDDAYDELLRLDSIHLEKPLNDSNWVNAQILKGKCLLKFRKYEEADQVFNDLTDNSKRLTYSQKADIESNIGSLLLLKEEFERAEEQYKKAIDLYYLHQDTLNHQLAITYNNMGYLCDLLVRYPEAISYYRKAQSKWELLHDTLHADLAHPYGNIGLVYEKMGLFKEARGLQEKALDIRMKTIPNHDFITYGLNNIGLLLIKEGDYETALHYFEKALSSSQINHNYFLNNIGLAYSKMNEHQKASEYFVRAHEIEKETFTSEHPIFADTYYNFAVEYRELGNYEKALQYLERSLNQRKRSPSSIEMGLISYHNEKALLFLLQKDTSKAIYHYKKSLKAAKNLFGQIHPDVSDAYYFLAKVSFEQKDLVSAKYYANKAAEAINGSDEEVESISDFQLVQILILKGDIEKERDESRLNSINYYKRALNLAEKLIESYMEQSSRQQLKEGIFGVYEKLIDANLYLHQRTDSLIYYEQAFQFAEESKAYRLKEAFNSINARKRTNIPDEILRKEEQLKFQLSQIKEERRKLNLNIEEEKESILIGTIFDLTQKLDSIKQIFKTNYPAYYKLKYNKKVISISEIQNQLLSNDKTLVEYFVGKDKIYIFIIQQAHHYVYEVPIDFPLQNWIKQMNKGVQGDFSNTPNKNIDYPLVYAQSAFNLQKKLIAPLLPLLSKESTIIFVKDGALNYLPFNILLLEKPIDPYEFRTHHYLFKDYNISNAYSATLLSQMKQKEHLKPTTNELLVFAPNFSDSINLVSINPHLNLNDTVALLKYNVDEANSINSIIKGRTLNAQEANRANFFDLANDCKILHLSTHAHANAHSATQDAYFVLHSDYDQQEYDLVTAMDLYNIPLNTDMVVLSACETEMGILEKGEGMTGLSHAFSYAGAKSLISSLWKVDEKSTYDLMKLFYRNIKAGQSKDQALRSAQLEFLKEHKNFEPYHWASFIATGDMSPIFQPRFSTKQFLSLIICVSLIGLILIRWKINT